MKIEIDIDDNELAERVTELIAAQFASKYSVETYQLKKSIGEVVKEVISADRSHIVEMAIDRAAGKIAYGAAPKLVKKITEENE